MSRSTKNDEFPLVIDNPELQARHKRVVYSAATLMAWSVWMYLWLPLVSLLAWWFGVRVFIRELVVPETRMLLLTLAVYAIVVAVLALLVVAWSQYNLRRFGRRQRRRAAPSVTDREIAKWFDVPEAVIGAVRAADTQLIRFGEDGRIEPQVATPVPV